MSSASINEAQQREDLAKRDGNTIAKRKFSLGEGFVLISPAVLESLVQAFFSSKIVTLHRLTYHSLIQEQDEMLLGSLCLLTR